MLRQIRCSVELIMTSDDSTGFFDRWDPCWLAGPNAAEVASAELVAPGDDAASEVVRRDHAQLRRRLGVPASERRVRVELVERADLGDEGFAVERRGVETRVVANTGRGLVHGFYRLLVTGLDDWAARLRDAGYPVLFDDEFPGMRRFYTEDPNGNRLEFLEPIPAEGR